MCFNNLLRIRMKKIFATIKKKLFPNYTKRCSLRPHERIMRDFKIL